MTEEDIAKTYILVARGGWAVMVGYLMDELHPQKKGWRALLFFFFF